VEFLKQSLWSSPKHPLRIWWNANLVCEKLNEVEDPSQNAELDDGEAKD
jgi:hypothetical protein